MAAKKRTKRRTMFQETWHRLLKNKGAVIGMAFLALLCVIALVSPLVFNYETDVIGQNLAIKLQPPSGSTGSAPTNTAVTCLPVLCTAHAIPWLSVSVP